MARKQTTAPGIQLSRRALVGQPIAVDRERRSFSIIITTETPVRTCIPNPACATISAAELEASDISWIEVDEVLLTAGMDYSRAHNAPFMDNHDTYRGLPATLGRVFNIRAEDGKIVGDPVLSRRHADLLDDIEDGLFPQISAGYVVNEYEIAEREGTVPLAVAVSWTLLEASVVPVGADPNAVVRSRGLAGYPMPKFRMRSADVNPPKQEKTMDIELEQVVADAIVSLEAVAEASDEGASEEVVARARRLREILDELTAAPEEEQRGKRGNREGEEDLDKDEEQRGRGKREGDEKLTEEEERELDDIEDVARSYGLRSFIRDLRKLGSTPASARTALRKKIEGGASSTPSRSEDLKPIRSAPRKPELSLNPADIFAQRAKLARGNTR